MTVAQVVRCCLNEFVALGWNKIEQSIVENNDISDADKKEYICSKYPTEKRPGLILSQLKCFYTQMKPNDLIVIPSKNMVIPLTHHKLFTMISNKTD